MIDCDVLIIGAGAAGLMAAMTAAQRGRRVIVLDRNDCIGKKILISGGGRCNFTNLQVTPHDFVSTNPHFCKSALARFQPQDMIALLQKHGVEFFEKKSGQLFCQHSSKNVVEVLAKECAAAHVQFDLGVTIASLSHAGNRFVVQAEDTLWQATSLIVATGGLSYPKLGASDLGYKIAEQFGHDVTPLAPALDGFVLPQSWQKKAADLAGVSLPVQISCGDFSMTEDLLFTHVGLSGPAALNASLYWQKNLPLTLDLLPNLDVIAWLKKMRLKSTRKIVNVLEGLLPARLVAVLAVDLPFLSESVAQISDKNCILVAETFKNWRLLPTGTVGYAKAEVTRGGVCVDKISSQTMQSHLVPDLYFVGEVLDVTGRLGGFNFQWAWASGFAAGQKS